MRYLKSYNESTIYSKDIETSILDILADTKDEGFRIDISVYEYTFNQVGIHVYITNDNRDFRFLEIKENVLHLVSYLKEEGFNFKAHYVFHQRPKEFDFVGASSHLDWIIMNRLELRFEGRKCNITFT